MNCLKYFRRMGVRYMSICNIPGGGYLTKEYGGYLPLELPVRRNEYFDCLSQKDVVRLDCGRSAFWYALAVIKPSKLYVPYLNCQNSTDPADALGIPYEYYRLEDDLTPMGIEPGEGEAVIWINYYGNARTEQIQKVARLCRNTNLIVDNCQAFFSEPLEGAYNCYSARKFFGVCDGAYLIKNDIEKLDLPEGESAQHALFLMSVLEHSTNELYPKSLANEERLGKEVHTMSALTRRILQSVDYEQVKGIRKRNMLRLHRKLEKYNEFSVNIDSDTHMYYPLLIEDEELRQRIVARHIYTPTWWRHVPSYFEENTLETRLSKYMLMIPIDQRYKEEDMDDISRIILEEYQGGR